MNVRLSRYIWIRISIFAAGVMLVAGAAMQAEEIKLPITADDSICCHEKEREFNQGGHNKVKMKGTENLVILNFDATKLQDKSITKATLHIKGSEEKMTVRHVGVSTIASPWKEGTQKDNKAAAGEPCFLLPKMGLQEKWAGPGSSFLDCYGGRGGTIWSQTYVTHDKDMWFAMEIDPRILEACAAGLGYGICMTDDNGQTSRGHKDVVKDGNFSNNWFYSKEQNNSAPYIIVEVAPKIMREERAWTKLALTVKPWTAGADLETGGLEISWPGPADKSAADQVLGYRLFLGVDGGEMRELPRWQAPAPVLAGETPRALLRWLKAGAEVKAKVEVVGRKGWITQQGEAAGKVSPAFPSPAPFKFTEIKNAAGAPPVVDGAKIWVTPDCTKANPITGNVMEEKSANYEGDPAGKYSEANCVWSGANKTVSLHSLRGEWVAFQVICQNKDAMLVSYSIQPGDLSGPDGAVIPASAFELSWLWYQKIIRLDKDKNPILPNDKAWYADPMVPLKAGDTFTVPNKLNAIENQTNQTVYVEFFVPKDAKAGLYKGTLTVAVGGEKAELTVQVNVGSALIPNETHFTWSMNTYTSPGELYGEAGSAEFNRVEQEFYKLSHLHRADLAVLHYSHSGRHQEGTAPEIIGKGKTAHVKDWTEWDKRFGPVLDGSLFKGTPREGSSMSHFYLNLFEHYPMTMEVYKWNDVQWEEHWKVSGPVTEGFPQEYKDAWVAVAKDYIKHAKDKKYLTPLQIYLNDKYFYKQYSTKKNRNGWGKGVSFWLLDEPQQIDDFEALAFFGDLVRQAQEGDRKWLYYRVDVSRPQWGRTYLDRVVDLNVSGGFGEYRHLLEDWRERYGQMVWTYGAPPSSDGSALGIVAQALDLYARGVDGFAPWRTLGGPEKWTVYGDDCVIYTGKPLGIMGPCASLRLKAYRRGEQDVEYVYLLAEQRGLLKNDPNRRQVGKLLDGAIQMTKKLGTLDEQGAVTESISGLTPDDFERLRIAIANELK